MHAANSLKNPQRFTTPMTGTMRRAKRLAKKAWVFRARVFSDLGSTPERFTKHAVAKDAVTGVTEELAMDSIQQALLPTPGSGCARFHGRSEENDFRPFRGHHEYIC